MPSSLTRGQATGVMGRTPFHPGDSDSCLMSATQVVRTSSGQKGVSINFPQLISQIISSSIQNVLDLRQDRTHCSLVQESKKQESFDKVASFSFAVLLSYSSFLVTAFLPRVLSSIFAALAIHSSFDLRPNLCQFLCVACKVRSMILWPPSWLAFSPPSFAAIPISNGSSRVMLIFMAVGIVTTLQ